MADLLVALGLAPSAHWPRRVFHDAAGVRITLDPVGEPVGGSAWSVSRGREDEPVTSLALRTASGELAHLDLDGVGIVAWPDRRRFAASALQPAGGSGSAPERAEAWVESLVSSGLAVTEATEVVWAEGTSTEVTGATRLHGPAGTQPITVVTGVHPLDRHDVVVIGVGDPVEVVERQPTIGDSPTAEQVGRIDDAFVLVLSGGVYAVRGRRRSVTRSLDGWGSSGRFADGEAVQWLEQAAAGRRTDGVVAGEPWVS